MEPIELRVRRVALGLSQDELARLAGVTQATISQWETGVRTPRDPHSIHILLSVLEGAHAEILDQLMKSAEAAPAERDSPSIILWTYTRDADYWADDTHAHEAGIPAALHRTATAHAAYLVREKYSIRAAIMPHNK